MKLKTVIYLGNVMPTPPRQPHHHNGDSVHRAAQLSGLLSRMAEQIAEQSVELGTGGEIKTDCGRLLAVWRITK